MTLAPADWAVVSAYVILLTILGFLTIRKQASADSFLLAGRSVTLPGFVVTLVTTWYGGILGVGEYSYLNGISAWVALGLPYYFFALIFAFWLAPRIHKSRLTSIPDQMEQAYGRLSGIISAVFTFFMVTPAPYALMSGVLISLVLPIPFWMSVLISLVLSTFFVGFGGYRSLVVTDFLQFAMMYAGFAAILFVAFFSVGGTDFLLTNLPSGHLDFVPEGSGWTLLIWFFIASMTLADPGFYQRCYSATSPVVARRGILISIGFWFIFDVMTVLTGLYARALSDQVSPPSHAYPFLGEQLLPPVLKGLFFTGMLATVWSTLNGFSFLAAQSIGRDFMGRLIPSTDREVSRTRWALLLVTGLAFWLSVWSETVVGIWFTLGSVVLPGLLIPLLCIHAGFVVNHPGKVWLVQLVSVLIAACWTWLFPSIPGWNPEWTGLAFYPGVVTAAGGMMVLRLKRT
ncbi:MAG: sodium:solute symporter family protein [Bacteroidetes bacterium]|nr:sodium:solute symporter family protein [Bacteroidota bacterium]